MEQTLGKRISKNRKKLNLTQDQLAEKLGVTAQAVSKWENDLSCPDINMLPRLAELFETTTDALTVDKVADACFIERLADAVSNRHILSRVADENFVCHWVSADLRSKGSDFFGKYVVLVRFFTEGRREPLAFIIED